MATTRSAARKAQQGLVLFIALIVLVAMSLAGIALLRSVDTGTLVAGNLAFRQAAMHTGDIGIEAGRSYLMGVSPAANLYNDNAGAGYYALWAENVDLLGNKTVTTSDDFDWSTAVNVTSPTPPAGYTVSYVIHRLCDQTGDPATAATCVRQTGAAATTGGGTKGAAAFGQMAISVPTNALYRITVRVLGPRNSTSFIQAVVF
ncbi:MAG: pilus assembly PilX family protein [Betaproteobacteria bacterium]